MAAALGWLREEVARNYKVQGNEYFQGRRFREAMGFYTQGIDAKPTEKGLLETLLINRAACNLALGADPFPRSLCPLTNAHLIFPAHTV